MFVECLQGRQASSILVKGTGERGTSTKQIQLMADSDSCYKDIVEGVLAQKVRVGQCGLFQL